MMPHQKPQKIMWKNNPCLKNIYYFKIFKNAKLPIFYTYYLFKQNLSKKLGLVLLQVYV